jgi:hypothetical protein
MPAKLGAQCAFGMFIAILMTGIFPEARAEPVILRPPAGPGGTIEIAQAESGKPTGNTVGRRDGPVVITTGLAQLLPLEKRAKTVIVGDHNLIEEGVRVRSLAAHRIYHNTANGLSNSASNSLLADNLGKQGGSVHSLLQRMNPLRRRA